MTTRRWDAASYDRVGAPMTEMAAAVLDRLPLAGDETVLDAGCGTGRVSEMLLDRLPRGKVIAVDADPEMVRLAQLNLAGRAEVRSADLLELRLDEPVDAILSTATFHWITDHERLFAQLFDVLRPGGRLVAQCGGAGNIERIRAAAQDVQDDGRFASLFDGWSPPWYYAGPDETTTRMEKVGFTDVRVGLQPWPVAPDDPAEYLATIPLGPQVQRLPEELKDEYVRAVLERLEQPVTVDYIRLNIEGLRPV